MQFLNRTSVQMASASAVGLGLALLISMGGGAASALSLPSPSRALADGEGVIQISGVGSFDGSCDAASEGADYAVLMTGDLEGCLYSFIETSQFEASGIYIETGTELFVDSGGAGTFETNYRFEAMYDEDGVEIWGRCQHPIVGGSGTGTFEGVTGRFNMMDDIEAGNFPYTGHLEW